MRSYSERLVPSYLQRADRKAGRHQDIQAALHSSLLFFFSLSLSLKLSPSLSSVYLFNNGQIEGEPKRRCDFVIGRNGKPVGSSRCFWVSFNAGSSAEVQRAGKERSSVRNAPMKISSQRNEKQKQRKKQQQLETSETKQAQTTSVKKTTVSSYWVLRSAGCGLLFCSERREREVEVVGHMIELIGVSGF